VGFSLPTRWGFARHGLVPDLVTLGKPMGNDHPVAGVVAQATPAGRFGRDVRYFNTFGGNPVSSAAGLAVLRVIRDHRLLENSATIGRYLRERLVELATEFPIIQEIRGDGLFVGIELARSANTPATNEKRCGS
jgi:4-aminobutyrate aminotransferase-like enzyme